MASAFPDLTAALPTLRVSVFLHAGDADQFFAGVRRAAAEIPGGTFVALPGVNHAQGFEAGLMVLPQVRAFLNQHE